jgi:hypothetical protein
MKEFDIIPYIEIDGIRTFPDSDILNIYDRIVDEGKEYICSASCGLIDLKEGLPESTGVPLTNFLQKLKSRLVDTQMEK